ncbi:hypothetical protein UY3_11235 [Chelonia mydas]|uniref:Uncharacterized protein n=1 Tax=Chelonia mydas TaxID=8469 RepID=M7B3G4_CHEMY|nr:hypothetical protein UY3_11235 [Chelonia mydas]
MVVLPALCLFPSPLYPFPEDPTAYRCLSPPVQCPEKQQIWQVLSFSRHLAKTAISGMPTTQAKSVSSISE